MKTTLQISTILFAALSGTVAQAASHRVNLEPVRKFFATQVITPRGEMVMTPIDHANPPVGISKQAIEKARQSLRGFRNFQGFNQDIEGGLYTVQMGKQKLVVTTIIDEEMGFHFNQAGLRFVARSGDKGLVVARGNVLGGEITWTRSHNEHAKTTPSERNDGK